VTPEECLAEYERLSSLRDFGPLSELIAPDAVYFFNDGSYFGIDEIRKAIEATWAWNPDDESYTLSDIAWFARGDDFAACTYKFRWAGVVKGCPFESFGRGTAVLRRDGERWRIVHEHLSADPSAG
jgi:ketosteroid isomerase-like protein